MYVKNKDNGYLLEDDSVDSIEHVLRQILGSSNNQKRAMRFKARKTAELYFDYNQYTDTIRNFLDEVIKC